jgi:hypothetical protein
VFNAKPKAKNLKRLVKMKKTVFIILLCLCSFRSYAFLSQGESGIEMFCGYSFAALKNFNDNYINVFDYGFLNGYASPVLLKAIPGILQADIKFRYFIVSGIPLYLRLGFTRLVDTAILHDTVSGLDIATSVVSFNTAYAGAGIKYGFKLSPGFSVFIGADGGCYIPVDSYWEVTGNTAASPPVNNTAGPLYNAFQRIDFTGVYFGGNAAAGIEWELSGSWGVIMEGGYRLARDPVAYKKAGIFTRAGFNFNELDFSGPYVTCGFVFYLGGK